MANNIVFVAKTNLNTDGRILNQLEILSQHYSNAKISIILFPDKKTTIQLPREVRLVEVTSRTRHSKILRPLTVVAWTFHCLRWLFNLDPTVVHAHDTAVVIPVTIFRWLKRNRLKVVYDDHELPNENDSLTKRWMNSLENNLLKVADYVLFANDERLKYLKGALDLDSSRLSYFLNMNYFHGSSVQHKDQKTIALDRELSSGIKMIVHQGPLKEERGRRILADFSKRLPNKVKILLLGGSEIDFNLFLEQFDLEANRFFFVGTVNYDHLPSFWSRCHASIVLYLPKYINNRLCAPNRLFLSVEYGLPVLVNRDNPVLSNFISETNSGFFIEDILTRQDFERLFTVDKKELKFGLKEMKQHQISAFLSMYRSLLTEGQ